MKKILWILVLVSAFVAGCDSLRLSPTEEQKQNAWLHNRTTLMATEKAKSEDASKTLQMLTKLSELQSRAFSAYYGLPKEFPVADTVEDILSQSNLQLAQTALAESAERPDMFQVADNVFELAIGICALLGGVYGTKAVKFLKEARTKSKALEEIISGNELFKKQHTESATDFKAAQQGQSPETRQIVAEMKS